MPQPLDWVRLLDEHRIPYVTKGGNVARGNVNINCPFCGSADTGQHMGINPTNGYWGCWRNQDHRGKSPLRLLVQLLKISYSKAREIAGLDADYVDPDGFSVAADRFLGRNQVLEQKEATHQLHFPKNFRPIIDQGRYLNYLLDRGFLRQHLHDLCAYYKLQCSYERPFNDRIILPYFMNGELVTWSARAIAPAIVRYKDLDIEQSVVPAKKTLYNYDSMTNGGKVLLVVEGPIDVLKLDFYGKDYGVRAVGLSTSSIQEEQGYMIEAGIDLFERVVFLMDETSAGTGRAASMKLKSKLAHLSNIGTMAVPYGRKDGGEMTPAEVVKFSKELIM